MVFRSLIKTVRITALSFGCLSTLADLHAANTWSPNPPASIPGAFSHGELTTTYDAASGMVLATWIDGNSQKPTYTFWNGSSWSPPLPIPGANAVLGGLRSIFDATSRTVLVTWLDGTGTPATEIPTYAVWDCGSSWISAAPIPGAAAARSLTTTYNPTSGTVLATWSDQTGMPTTKIPTYAVWSGGSSWISAAPIPGAVAAADDANFKCTYNAESETVLATWVDGSNDKPTYAFWDGSSWSSSVMNPPTPIPLSIPGAFDLTSTYNATSKTVLVTWLNGTITPTYAVWAGNSSWVPAGPIPGAVAAAALEPNLTTTYNATSGTVLTTWFDSTNVPTYAIWSGGSSWSSSSTNPPASIPGASAAVHFSLTTTYAAPSGTVVATWLDSTYVPTYAIWTGGSSWFPAIAIPGASPSGGQLTSTYNPTNGTVLTTWIDLAAIPIYAALTISTSRAFQRPSNRQ